MQTRKNIFITLATALFLVVLLPVTNYFCHTKKSDTKNPDAALALIEWKAPDTSQLLSIQASFKTIVDTHLHIFNFTTSASIKRIGRGHH